MTTEDFDTTAQAAYRAYAESVGFKNFRGDPMPAWQDLGDSIQTAWRAAARAAIVNVVTNGLIRPGQ